MCCIEIDSLEATGASRRGRESVGAIGMAKIIGATTNEKEDKLQTLAQQAVYSVTRNEPKR